MAEQTDGQDAGFDGGEVQGTEQGGQDVLLGHLQEMSTKLDQLIPQAPEGPSFGEITDPSYDPYENYGQEYEQPEPQYDPAYDPAYQQPYQQPQSEPPGMSPDQAREWLQGEIQKGVQEAVNPIVAQQRAMQLEAQFPDLKNPETIQQITPEAQRLAQSMGLGPDGWRNPDFLAMVYQAQQARQSASQQIAPEDQQFDANGYEGGGAGAPNAGDEPNMAERILAAYPHGDAHTFWGA